MLMEGADVDRIVRHLKRGNLERLKNQIDIIIEMLWDPRLVDSLKGVFFIYKDLTDDIERARRAIEMIQKAI